MKRNDKECAGDRQMGRDKRVTTIEMQVDKLSKPITITDKILVHIYKGMLPDE